MGKMVKNNNNKIYNKFTATELKMEKMLEVDGFISTKYETE